MDNATTEETPVASAPSNPIDREALRARGRFLIYVLCAAAIALLSVGLLIFVLFRQ